MDTAEDLQVVSCGVGGQYISHQDHVAETQVDELFPGLGNRIATWLMYASNVELGGATVFPKAELSLFPKKGSAAFWYNLHQNGRPDEMTQHAACPVLVGTKLGKIEVL